MDQDLPPRDNNEDEFVKRTVLAAAVAVAALPLLTPVPASAAVTEQRAVTLTATRGSGEYALATTRRSMAAAKATGVNMVGFVYQNCQKDQYAHAQSACWNTPTGAALTTGLRNARALGLRTTVVMHQEARNGEWRGNFCPRDRRAWFYAYRTRVLAVARIAQAARAEQLIIGSEMPCLTLNVNDRLNEARWRWIIGDVRKVYTGKLTYSAQRDSDYRPYSELDQITFWNALDVIGVSAYYPMAAGSPSVATLRSSWERVVQTSLLPQSRKWRKNVVLTEVGFRSIRDAQVEPWNYQRTAPIDLAAQARSYEAVLDMVRDHAFLTGVHLWFWSPNPNAGGLTDRNYTPQRKPAQTVMTRFWRP